MIILGVDPGIERLGYAFMEFSGNSIKPVSYGLISTKKETPRPERLLQIYNDLDSLIRKHKPTGISVETIIFAKNVKTALIVSEVRGVIQLLASQHSLEYREFTPLKIKMALTGYGRSSKGQIQKAIQLFLSLPQIPKPDDVSDAIAIAICGGNNILYQNKIRDSKKFI